MERDRRLALRDPRRRVEDWRRVVVEVRACGSDDLARPRLPARVARDGPEQRPPIRRRGASACCPGGRNSIWRVRRKPSCTVSRSSTRSSSPLAAISTSCACRARRSAIRASSMDSRSAANTAPTTSARATVARTIRCYAARFRIAPAAVAPASEWARQRALPRMHQGYSHGPDGRRHLRAPDGGRHPPSAAGASTGSAALVSRRRPPPSGRARPAPDGSGRQAVGLDLDRGELPGEENPSIEEKFSKPG